MTFRVTIDETIPIDRTENALRGLPHDLALTANRARVIQPSSRQSPHALSVPPEVRAREAEFLAAALAILGGGDRQRRAARFLYAHRQDARGIYVTDDVTVFGAKDDDRRRRLYALAETKIMTLEEFEQFCDDWRRT